MRRVLILLGALALAALESGCTKTSCNDRDPDLVVIKRSEGIVIGNTFFTSTEEGPFLHYPAGRTYVFEHDFDSVVTPFYRVAFSPTGNLAQAAGDMVVAHHDNGFDVNNTSSVLNNTCSEFFLWASITAPTVAAAPEPQGEAGAPAQ